MRAHRRKAKIITVGMVLLACACATADNPNAFAINELIGRGINIGNALEAPVEGEWGVTIKEEYFDLKEGRFSAFPESDFYTTPIHTSARLSELIDKPMRTFTEHKIPKAERQVLMQTLLSYYRIHVSGFRELNTLDILEKMYQNL